MTKQCTFYYEHAEPTGNWTLEELLKTTMQLLRTPAAREEVLDLEGSRHRVLGHLIPFDVGVAGQLMEYEPGAVTPVIQLSADRSRFVVSGQSPSNARQEFAQGLLYFYVEKNHIVLSQQNRYNKKHFESHVRYLLGAIGGRDATFLNTGLTVRDVAPEQISRRLQRAKSILVPVVQNRRVDGDSVTAAERQSSTRAPAALLTKLLSFIPGASQHFRLPQGVTIAKALERDEIDVELRITYHGRVPQDGSILADAIANAVRNADSDDYVIDLAGQGKIKAGEFRKRVVRGVQVAAFGLPDEASMYEELCLWLQELRALQDVVE